MNERKAFLDEIEKDPENTSVRPVFADWLEDNDEPELADFMRSWTLEKYREGKKYLEELAAYIQEQGRGEYEYESYSNNHYTFTYKQLMEGLREAVNTHKDTILFGFQTPNRLCTNKEMIKMWQAFEMVTSIKVKEGYESNSPFCCAC